MEQDKEVPRSAPDREEFEQWAKTRGWGVARGSKGYNDERTQGAWAMRCEMAHGPLGASVRHPDTVLLDFVASEYLDLQAFEMPTGAGDADVGWKVIQHHMAAPKEREVGVAYRDDPREALREAMKGLGYKQPDAAAPTERERQLLFALQAAWPYVHGWCTIQSARNQVSQALFGRPDNGRAALKVASEVGSKKEPAAPAGDWLWVQFMDWCKKRRVHPGDYNDLFAIVGRAREVVAAAAGEPKAAPEMPSNEELENLWETTHYGHPADFAADVLQRWGGWPAGMLGYGGALEEALRIREERVANLPGAGLRAEITQHACCISVSVEQFIELEKLDSLEVVFPALEKAGAVKGTIEYSGHFGPNVFFDIENGKDPQQVARALSALIDPQPEPSKKGFTP